MTTANAEQAAYWSEAGQSWATHQEILDDLLSGALDAVMESAAPKAGECILDVGCGTGASSIRLAEKVGDLGHVTALDISAPLLSVAKSRGAGCGNLDFVLGDAQTYPVEKNSIDLVFFTVWSDVLQ